MANKSTVAQPIVTLVQKIILYKTKGRYYLVGCNNTESKFRVLKVDRTESKELNVVDDKDFKLSQLCIMYFCSIINIFSYS
ncbi:polyphosphoinositide phosphatase-like [Stegodyphus dumicola]|uniref:polyphosphoinositide phosphatase-like n=1 Tax=Stegodyphus dumicola TaxID=202533 RepID=UPI0015A92F3E|nr:polyphosphoinositide phosphatase-like [Stegodyphus dumicola]